MARARAEAAPRWLIDLARADLDNPMWCTGIIPHPADEMPAPSVSDAVLPRDVAGDPLLLEDLKGMGGDIAVDGSCEPYAI